MPRRTGLDTLFDNETTLTAKDLQAMALEGGLPDDFPLDPEDYNQKREGVPGEFGNTGEDDDGEGGPLSKEDFQTAIAKGIEAAEDFIDMEHSPDRELAAQYYRAEPLGNEVEGRSGVVMSEVRDTVLAIMPALLRIFCGAKNPVQFDNQPGTPFEQGTQQTAYISHIINRDNDGFMMHHSAFKDALIRRTGVITWWHEEVETVTKEIKTGLNEEAFALEQLEVAESSSEDENITYEIEVLDERPDTTDVQGQDPLEGIGPEGLPQAGALVPPPPPPAAFIRDISVNRRFIKKRHRVDCVPPEEFILTPIATSDIDRFPLVGRRQRKTIGELVAMGHNEDEIREKIGGQGSRATSLQNNAEAIARQKGVVERLFDNNFAEVDPASEYVKYCCVYVLIDTDGDGILERHKVCTVGDNNQVIYDSIVDEMVPYAILCPDPEPHSPFGYSVGDQNMDMQEIKSEIVRGVIDNLAQSIVGRTGIIEGRVNIDDVLSNDRDQVIRAKEAGAVWSLSHPFTGMNAIPVLQYLDTVKTQRTGIYTGATGGLSADVLQSTPTKAAEQMVNSSQERPEMIARIFAEQLKRLYRGLLQNVVRHQDTKRVLRLRGREVVVDPRAFNTELDLDVNVGLGRGTSDKRIIALEKVMAKQQEIYEKYGPTNEIVTLIHISNAAEDYIAEYEITDIGRYMNRVTPEMNERIVETAKNAPKQPSAEELLYKANQEKIMADSENKRRSDMIKLAIEAAKLAQKEDQSEQDFYIKVAEMLGKFGIQVNEQAVKEAQALDTSADRLVDSATAGAQQQIGGPQNAGTV